MIELKNINKTYKSKKTESTKAIDDISVKFGNHGLVFIVGASGSGKSTLLNVLGGLDSIDSGDIMIDSEYLNKFDSKKLDMYRNKYVGFVFQEYNVIEDYNLEENITLSLDLQGIKDDKKVEEVINKVGLNGLNKREINELSGGQKQRVAIARAIVKNPKLLLCDEPTGNLDSKTSKQIIELLKEISNNTLVIVVSHNMELAKTYSDRIIEISDGKIITDNDKSNEYIKEEFVLKESKLPMSRILKLSLGNMKHKVGRMILTTLITIIVSYFLTFFINIMFFNQTDYVYKNIKDNYIDRLEIKNGLITNLGDEEYYSITDEDYNYINNLSNNNAYIMYELNDNGESLKLNLAEYDYNINLNSYYNTNDAYFIEVNENSYISNLMGSIPTSYNEIAIDEYFAEEIIKYGIYDKDNIIYKPTSYDEIINDNIEISIGNVNVSIVGISLDSESYNKTFEYVKSTGKWDINEQRNFYNSLDNSIYHIIYTNGLIDKVNIEYEKENIINDMNIDKVSNLTLLQDTITYYDFDGNIVSTNTLASDEIIVSEEYIKKLLITNNISFDTYVMEILENDKNKTYEQAENEVIQKYMYKAKDKALSLSKNGNTWLNLNNKLKIVGISTDDNSYVSNSIFDNISINKKQAYSLVILTNDKNTIKNLLDNTLHVVSYDTSSYKGYMINYRYYNIVTSVITLMNSTNDYVRILTAVLILLETLLIYNFVVVTIKFAQKNIGILRALGTKNKDIIKIFSIEAFILSSISWIVSTLLCISTCNLLNNTLYKQDYLIYESFIIEPIAIISTILLILYLTFATTILGISRLSKINHVDAINNKI